MTYTQALLRIYNPEAYPRQQVREAALKVLATMGAKKADLDQASFFV